MSLELLEHFFNMKEFYTYTDKHNVKWFNGTEVCDALGYKNSKMTIPYQISEYDRVRDDLGNWFINQYAFYTLLIKSKHEISHMFLTWLTRYHLPTLTFNPDNTSEKITTPTKMVDFEKPSIPTKIDLIFSQDFQSIKKALAKRNIIFPPLFEHDLNKQIVTNDVTDTQKKFDLLFNLASNSKHISMVGVQKLRAFLIKLQ